MPRLIKDGVIVADNWHWVEDREATAADLPEGDVLVPLTLWQAERDALLARPGRLGLWLATDEEAETIADDLQHFSIIGLHFPIFHDGRNLSNAVLLRSRFGFQGELRALGDVSRDLLPYMRRCGMDAFLIPDHRDAEHALAGLDGHITRYYQAAVTEPEPLFRRVERSAA